MNHRLFRTVTISLSLSLGMAFLPEITKLNSEAGAPTAIAQTQLQTMTLERLENILQAEGNDLLGQTGQWQLTIEDQTVIVLADATNDRMRIFTPVAPAASLSVAQVEAMLVANFHAALDARYAVTDGNVVAVYVHPLASLQANELRSALQQVANLAANFGTSYSSGELGFGPENAPADDRKVPAGVIGI